MCQRLSAMSASAPHPLPTNNRGPSGVALRAADFITAAVGDVERPTANVKRPKGLDHIPGNRSFLDFLAGLRGVITRGNAYYLERIERYGPIYAQEDGEGTAVFVADPEGIATIAKNADGVWSTALGWHSVFEGVPPGGALDFPTALDFTHHEQARRLLTPAFNASSLDSYANIVAPMFREAIDGYLARGSVPFKREARALFGRAGASIFMGIDEPEEARLLERALVDVWGSFQLIVRNEWLSPKFRHARRGYRTLLTSFRSKFAERRSSDRPDLFSRLCREHQGPDWIDDETVVRLFIGVMTAAFDTTASAVTNMAYLLAQNPTWQERLREQAREIPLSEVGRDLPRRLPELEWTFKEALRRYPVAAALLRSTLRDTQLCGYAIPAGSQVYALTAPVLWDPRYFTDPLGFDPERFSKERAEHESLGPAFMPFGGGAHVCVGNLLSLLEATVFFHQLLCRGRFRLKKPYEARHQMTPLGCVSGKVELIFEPLG
jgi:cytochrome P450